MYYFVLEQAKNRWQAGFQNRIAAFLDDLQIVGEIAKANPIQKVEELCQLGLKKGYHTIVIIGTDTTISTLAALIAKQGATLGIEPIDPESSFYNLIGCTNWEQACLALPKRRVATFDMGQAGAERFFLTYVKIAPDKAKKPSQVLLEIADFKAEVPALSMTVANGPLGDADSELMRQGFSDSLLDIYVTTQVGQTNSSIISSIFKTEQKTTFSSLFHADRFRVSGLEQILNVLGPDDRILTKTPIEFSIVPSAIKVIIKKSSGVKAPVKHQ